jgi:hypothetical protein
VEEFSGGGVVPVGAARAAAAARQRPLPSRALSFGSSATVALTRKGGLPATSAWYTAAFSDSSGSE